MRHHAFLKLFSSLIAMMISTHVTATSCVVPPSGLVSWWNAGVSPGDTSDVLGSNGGISATSLQYVEPGKVGETAFLFGGSEEAYVRVPNSPSLEPTAGLTVDAWVQADDSPGLYRYVIAKGADGCEASSFGLYTGSNGGLQFYVYDGVSYHLSNDAGHGIWDGSWHFVAATYTPVADGLGQAGFIELYVDGLPVGDTSTSVRGPIAYELDDRDLLIGSYQGGGCSLPFKGAIDEVEIFDRALSSNEIKALFAADSEGKCEIEVEIDIKPGSDPNSINLRSAGVIPVAILSDVDFDATLIDPFSVELNGAGVKLVGNKNIKPLCHDDDANGDGLTDMICQVYTVDFIVEPGNAVATLKARTISGQWIYGDDFVNVVQD